MIRNPVLVAAIVVNYFVACTQTKSQHEQVLGSPCEDCELLFEGMPKQISWRTTISEPDEPGEPLIISGKIFKKDGKTPAPGVILYIYQTDNRGLYSPSSNQILGKAHGHLRGWMKTDEQGRYEFKTIRPAPYPNRKDPQHIHPIIYEPGKGYYWVDDYLFDDDPLLTEQQRNRPTERGGLGIIKVDKSPEGVWIGSRDIVLSF